MEALLCSDAGPRCVIGGTTVQTPIDWATALNGTTEVKRVERKQDLFVEGEEVGGLFVLREGWAYRYRLLDDGRRYITTFLMDGDVIGPFTATATHYVATLTDATIGRMSTLRLRTMLDGSPALVAAVANAMNEEYEMLSQRALNLARCNAKERMAQLLIELADRTRDAGLSDGTSFRFPACQDVIADCLGLSVVHVNRTLRCLREDGIVIVGAGHVHILEHAQLASLARAEDSACAA